MTLSSWNVSADGVNRVNKFWTKLANNESCPDSYGGNPQAYLSIKYFYSKFCPWCIKEEPILKRLIKNQGNSVRIDWYNVKNCPNQVEKYKISGVPSFVLSTPNNQTEYKHYGFIPEKDLIKFACDVTGECAKTLSQEQLEGISNKKQIVETSSQKQVVGISSQEQTIRGVIKEVEILNNNELLPVKKESNSDFEIN